MLRSKQFKKISVRENKLAKSLAPVHSMKTSWNEAFLGKTSSQNDPPGQTENCQGKEEQGQGYGH